MRLHERASSYPEWRSIAVLVPFRRRPFHKSAAIAFLATHELDLRGGYPAARPVITIAACPDARVLAANQRLAAELTLDLQGLALASVLIKSK
jgi:hypothetical protein